MFEILLIAASAVGSPKTATLIRDYAAIAGTWVLVSIESDSKQKWTGAGLGNTSRTTYTTAGTYREGKVNDVTSQLILGRFRLETDGLVRRMAWVEVASWQTTFKRGFSSSGSFTSQPGAGPDWNQASVGSYSVDGDTLTLIVCPEGREVYTYTYWRVKE